MATYLSPSKISKKYTSNSTYLKYKSSGLPYKGYFIETTGGRFYEGTSNVDIGVELILNKDENNLNNSSNLKKQLSVIGKVKKYNILKEEIKNNLIKKNNIASAKPQPLKKDYTAGFFIRYFAKRINGDIYFELNKKVYDSMLKKEPTYDYNLYEIGALTWYIKGINVQKLNSNILKRAANKFRNINYLFPILNEYIEPLSVVQENLYTNGGELYYSDSTEYIGAYHIHPVSGPMEGAFHKNISHSKLYYFKQLPQISTQSYEDFAKNYDKTECFKCIEINNKFQVISIPSSRIIGCPPNSYSEYEKASNSCSNETTQTDTPQKESGY